MGDDLNSLKTKLSDVENRLSQLEKELNQVKDNQRPAWLRLLQWACTFAIIAIFVFRMVLYLIVIAAYSK